MLMGMFSTLWVDVRDIAEAHVRALQRPKAGGSRYIIAAGPSKWQDFGEHRYPISTFEAPSLITLYLSRCGAHSVPEQDRGW